MATLSRLTEISHSHRKRRPLFQELRRPTVRKNKNSPHRISKKNIPFFICKKISKTTQSLILYLWIYLLVPESDFSCDLMIVIHVLSKTSLFFCCIRIVISFKSKPIFRNLIICILLLKICVYIRFGLPLSYCFGPAF